MNSADYLHSGQRLVTMGYCMDFGLTAILKIIWVGHRELTYGDVKGLAKVGANKFIAPMRGAVEWLQRKLRALPAAVRKSAPASASSTKPHLHGGCGGLLQGGTARQLSPDEEAF